MCFIETKWKFLKDKHHEVNSFFELPQLYGYRIHYKD